MAAAAMAIALTAGAQTPAPAPAPADSSSAAPAQAPATAPAAPAAAPTWSVGPMDLSGFIDGYYSFNFNRPNSSEENFDQINQLYNFNDKTDQFELSAAKLTLNHAPDPIGADIDFIYGRTNELINKAPSNSTLYEEYDDTYVSEPDQLPYLEQAYLSLKPPKAKGFELDFGKWVTSAGAEVIEAMNNWNYSRSLLFVNAIPYWHFGARTSMPAGKFETVGFQLFNGWNNISKSNGGVSGAFTSAWVKPKYTIDANYLVGPENYNTTNGLRNLIDATLLLTPPGKVNAYINYDFGMNQDGTYACGSSTPCGDNRLNDWWGAAGAVHVQATAKNAIALRGEYFTDPDGFQTGTAQNLVEGTFTYEYKWVEGMLMRVEYRCDASNKNYFNKLASQSTWQQQTVTVAFIAFFGPKR
jgi:Putative beta-barrel porin-2, OmpL-like. bbp2